MAFLVTIRNDYCTIPKPVHKNNYVFTTWDNCTYSGLKIKLHTLISTDDYFDDGNCLKLTHK